MRKFFIILTVLVSIATIGYAVYACGPDKITICHHTSSETHPWEQLVFQGSAIQGAINGHFLNNGTPKSGHEQDLLYEGVQQCPTWCGDGTCNGEESCSTCSTDCGSCGGGGGCTLPGVPQNFDAQTGVLNDNKMELSWAVVPSADYVNIRWGYEDGNWIGNLENSPNDGQQTIGGLVNGLHYWFSIQAENSCGEGNWSASIDPTP